MPSSPLEAFPLLVQALLGTVIAIGLVAASAVLGKKLKNKVKDTPYECGMNPQGGAGERFSVKFYLVAMLFILFDIKLFSHKFWGIRMLADAVTEKRVVQALLGDAGVAAAIVHLNGWVQLKCRLG